MDVEGTPRPTPRPLRALPVRIIPTEEKMLARPMRRKEKKKVTPAKMIENFLPPQLRETEERLLPSIAPSGGRDTGLGMEGCWIISKMKRSLTYP